MCIDESTMFADNDFTAFTYTYVILSLRDVRDVAYSRFTIFSIFTASSGGFVISWGMCHSSAGKTLEIREISKISDAKELDQPS